MLVLNASEPLTAEDRELLTATADTQRILILNKTDLPKQLDMTAVKAAAGDSPIIETSILQSTGMDQLESTIAHLFFDEGIESSQNTVMVTNAAHRLLHQANDALMTSNTALRRMPVDLVQRYDAA